MPNEHSLIRSIHRPLRKKYDIDIWKINANFCDGVPDAWYSGPANDIWVEYKWVHAFPKRATTLIDMRNEKRYLSKLQQEWLRRKNAHNISTAVICGSIHGIVIFPALSWETPISVEQFLQEALSQNEVAEYLYTFCTKAGPRICPLTA